MEKKPGKRFYVEKTETQVGRRAKVGKDGVPEFYLTRRHARVLKFIGNSLESGWNPTFREMQEHIGYKTPGGARRAVLALAEAGLVETNIRSSRSTRLTDEGYAVFEKLRANPIRKVK